LITNRVSHLKQQEHKLLKRIDSVRRQASRLSLVNSEHEEGFKEKIKNRES